MAAKKKAAEQELERARMVAVSSGDFSGVYAVLNKHAKVPWDKTIKNRISADEYVAKGRLDDASKLLELLPPAASDLESALLAARIAHSRLQPAKVLAALPDSLLGPAWSPTASPSPRELQVVLMAYDLRARAASACHGRDELAIASFTMVWTVALKAFADKPVDETMLAVVQRCVVELPRRLADTGRVAEAVRVLDDAAHALDLGRDSRRVALQTQGMLLLFRTCDATWTAPPRAWPPNSVPTDVLSDAQMALLFGEVAARGKLVKRADLRLMDALAVCAALRGPTTAGDVVADALERSFLNHVTDDEGDADKAAAGAAGADSAADADPFAVPTGGDGDGDGDGDNGDAGGKAPVKPKGPPPLFGSYHLMPVAAHQWHQLAMIYYAARRWRRAQVALEELLAVQPDNTTAMLLLARLEVEHLNRPRAAVKTASAALEALAPDHPQCATARLLLGMAHMAWSCGDSTFAPLGSFADAQAHQQAALRELRLAVAADSTGASDVRGHYLLALQLAMVRSTSAAFDAVQAALRLSPNHVPSWHLLGLLLSSRRQFGSAAQALRTALKLAPDAVVVALSLCSVHLAAGESARALAALNLAFGAAGRNAAAHGGRRRAAAVHVSPDDAHRLLVHEYESEPVPTAAPSAAEAAETGLSLNAGGAALWVAAGAAYLSLGEVDQAQQCLEEARRNEQMTVAGGSADVLCLEAAITERQTAAADDAVAAAASLPAAGHLHAVAALYERALTVDATHTEALLGVARLHAADGDWALAEQELRTVLDRDGTNSSAWQQLGAVYEATQRAEQAAECLLTAAELDATAPVVPYAVLPRRSLVALS